MNIWWCHQCDQLGIFSRVTIRKVLTASPAGHSLEAAPTHHIVPPHHSRRHSHRNYRKPGDEARKNHSCTPPRPLHTLHNIQCQVCRWLKTLRQRTTSPLRNSKRFAVENEHDHLHCRERHVKVALSRVLVVKLRSSFKHLFVAAYNLVDYASLQHGRNWNTSLVFSTVSNSYPRRLIYWFIHLLSVLIIFPTRFKYHAVSW